MAESTRIDLTNYYNPFVGKEAISSSEMLNRYMWNRPTVPTPEEIRNNPDEITANVARDRDPVSLDVKQHMSTGPGRFVSAADFPIFQKFFSTVVHEKTGLERGKTYSIHGNPIDGQATNKLPVHIYDPDQTLAPEEKGVWIKKYQYLHTAGNDFKSRAFIYGTEGYEVTDLDNLKFIVHENGRMEIQGLKIRPDADNFDFTSGTPGIQQINDMIIKELDPNKIGKTVPIEYTGEVDPLTVTQFDFYLLQELREGSGLVSLLLAKPVYELAALDLKTELTANLKDWIGEGVRRGVEELKNRWDDFWQGPIVVDLDGDGVETTALAGGVRFDHNRDGKAEQTGWAGKDDGLLVRDLNKNGIIDNGGELFGHNTLMGDGKTNAKNGFEALSRYDDNGNGQIDAGDARWTELQIWKDADADGVTDKGELKTLDAMGITSIKLDYTETGSTDANGNLHKQSSSATWKDGKTTDAVDVWFRTEGAPSADMVNKFTHTKEIDELPEVLVSGNVHHLRDAMTQDEDLVGLVKAYVAKPSEGLLEELIYQWTGTDEIDPKDGLKHTDMRKLAVLEKLTGSSFDIDGDDWDKEDGKKVEEEFSRFADYVAGNIEIQELYSQHVGGEMYTADADGNISADWIGVNLNIDKHLLDKNLATASDMAEATADALTFNDTLYDYMIGSAQAATVASFHYGEVTDLKKLAELDGTVGDDGNNHLKAGSEHNILLEGAVLFGDDGNDKLKGGKDNDVLVGGAGNDKLEGKGGSDLYVFEKDFGKDKIDSDDDDEGSDVIRFAEYLQTDLNFVRSSDNLVITTKEGDNALKVEDFFEDGKDGASIDSIVFADYSFLDKNAIKDLAETVEVGCGSKATDGHGCFKYAEKLSAPAMHSAPALDEATMEIVG